VLISLLPILVLYIPFILKAKHFFFLTFNEVGFVNVLKNWDGPHYIVVARSFYDLAAVEKLLFTSLPAIYYTAHFPLYPLFIAAFAPILGYFYSGLFVNLLFGILLNVLFFRVAQRYTKHPLFLTFVFTVFPARFFITRAIVAPETMMVFCIFLALVLWEEKKYFSSSLFGALGVLAKVKAGFLFPAFLAEKVESFITERKPFDPRMLWSLMIPGALLGLFAFFYIRTGDFFAFFQAEKGNELFVTFPFAQFNSQAAWVGTAWLEDVVLYFVAMFLLVATLFFKKENRSWFYYCLFYTAFLIFVPQRDITRFAYPMYPFFLLTFERFFTSKEWKIALIVLLPAIYFFAWNFMIQNQAPIANFAPFL
jgi:Gpi18-like mannosyltransferase